MTKQTHQERIAVGNRVTITPRGKKKIWTADFWNDGAHRRQSLKTSNKKVAIDRATKLERDLLHGTHRVVRQEVSIEQAVEDYLTYLTAEGRARKTIVKYRGQLETFRDFCHEQRVRPLGRISPSLFDRYRAHRRDDLHHNTHSQEDLNIKQFLKWCMSRHHLSVNPLADVEISKPILTARPAPTLAQVQNILNSCSASRKAMLAVLAFTGMRSGELRQLRREDVDLEGGWFRVISRDDARTKTKTSRKVPMHPVLQTLLKSQSSSPGPWLFCAEPSSKFPAGDHWVSTKKLNEYFLARVKQLGLAAGRDTEGGYTIHSLRHFTETHCVNAGIPQRVVDTWLGHKSDRSMASVYYRLNDEESHRFMHGLDFALQSQP